MTVIDTVSYTSKLGEPVETITLPLPATPDATEHAGRIKRGQSGIKIDKEQEDRGGEGEEEDEEEEEEI